MAHREAAKMNQDEISQLAREIVSEIIPDLKKELSLTFIEDLGEPVLVATAGSSVLHLNPQRWAEKIIREHVRRATFLPKEAQGDVEAQRRLIIYESKKDLIHLLCAVNLMLGDALWVLEQLSQAVTVDHVLGPFFQNVQIGVKWSTLEVIEGRLREILRLPGKSLAVSLAERDEMMGGKYDYAITDTQMINALKQLERFSINKLAKLLTPERDDFRKSVYDWMRRKGIGRSELEVWWRKMCRDVEKSE
jgi:hypothetical protein